jgi:hypothetical protein
MSHGVRNGQHLRVGLLEVSNEVVKKSDLVVGGLGVRESVDAAECESIRCSSRRVAVQEVTDSQDNLEAKG